MKKEKEPTIIDLSIKIDNLTKTVDDLASATAVGFADIQEKLNQHDQRFDQMDQKIDSVNFGFSKKIEDEIRSVKAEISLGLRELKEEVKRLDQRINQVLKQNRGDINVLLEEQEKIKSRLKKLELKNSHG